MSSDCPQILVVDDDNLLLKIFRNSLDESKFEFVPAVRGSMALELLKDKEHRIKVVVCDMLMPEMDGLELLTRIQKLYPELARVLLTGSDDIAHIAEVINQTEVFRFIKKPIQPIKLNKTIQDAVDYYDKVLADQNLLQTTLVQSVDALVKVLEITNGIAHSVSENVKAYATMLGKKIGVPRIWSLEIAAELSQLGCITIPELSLERYYWGDELTPKETGMIKGHPSIAQGILQNIPRLEHIGNTIVAAANRPDIPAFEEGDFVAIHGALIKFATEFDLLIRKGRSKEEAIETLSGKEHGFPEAIIEAMEEIELLKPKQVIIELEIDKIKSGMWIEEDVKTHEGVMIVSKGYRINESIRNRLVNFSDEGEIDHLIKVRVDR
jgi:response regulator RpfG family c-di-GMP phosphodiesterase